VQPADIPPPDEPITVEAYFSRWPSGAEKCELFDGALQFTGVFDQRDVEMAERVYPGLRVMLNPDGNIVVHPAGPLRGIWARLAEHPDHGPFIESSRTVTDSVTHG